MFTFEAFLSLDLSFFFSSSRFLSFLMILLWSFVAMGVLFTSKVRGFVTPNIGFGPQYSQNN